MDNMEVLDINKKSVPAGRVEKGIRPFMLGGSSEFTIFQEPNKKYKFWLKANKNRTLWFVYVEDKYQGFIKRVTNNIIFM